MYLCGAPAGDDWVIWECALLLLSWCCLNKCVKCQDFSKSIINSPHTVILIVSVESCSWIKLQQIWDFQRAESLQTRFLVSSSLPPPSLLARPYHCAVIHPECSQMQSGVLGTQLRMPGSSYPRFWSWRERLFLLTKEKRYQDKLGCQSEAQYS